MHLIILKQTKAYNMIQLELGVEQRRNRKFDPETEISASESDFRFRLCSTPTLDYWITFVSQGYPELCCRAWTNVR